VLGSSRQRPGVWILGSRLACMAVLHAWSDSVAGTVARQLAVSSVWRTTLKGHCKDSDETEGWESLRSWASSCGETSWLAEICSNIADLVMCGHCKWNHVSDCFDSWIMLYSLYSGSNGNMYCCIFIFCIDYKVFHFQSGGVIGRPFSADCDSDR